MAKCSAGNCSKTCKNGCGCVSDASDPSNCSCWCGKDGTLEPTANKLHPDTKVNICVKEIELMELAVALQASFSGEILIPAMKAYKQVSLEMNEIPMGEVIDSLGLVYRREGDLRDLLFRVERLEERCTEIEK